MESVAPLIVLVIFTRVNVLCASSVKGHPKPRPFDDIEERSVITSSKVPTLAEAKYYAHLTAAVYCNGLELSNWTCGPCLATSKDVKLLMVIENEDHTTRAIVTSNSVKKELVFTFWQNESILNMITDNTMERVNIHGEAINVHKGTWAAMNSLYKKATQILRDELRKNPKYQIVLAGHSFGGMVASLFLYALRTSNEFKNLPYALYSYGQPRVGNPAFVRWMNSQTFKIIRVVNKGDMAAHVVTPSGLDYVHYNTELWITPSGRERFCSRNVYEDSKCSNSMTPAYNLNDHLKYWDTDYSTCANNKLTFI